jgi:DUF3102 family protein
MTAADGKAAERADGSNRLPILASSINEHLIAAEAATRRGLEHAIAAGLLLIEAKELVGHGEWLAWLQANCQTIGQRQAQTYMRLARNRHRFDATKNAATAHLTIAAAEAVVGRPRPERLHGLPGQLDLLGDPEVIARPAAPTVLRGRALFNWITDLEQVLRIIKQEERRRQGDKRRSRFRAAASTVAAAIAYFKELYLKQEQRRQERAR